MTKPAKRKSGSTSSASAKLKIAGKAPTVAARAKTASGKSAGKPLAKPAKKASSKLSGKKATSSKSSPVQTARVVKSKAVKSAPPARSLKPAAGKSKTIASKAADHAAKTKPVKPVKSTVTATPINPSAIRTAQSVKATTKRALPSMNDEKLSVTETHTPPAQPAGTNRLATPEANPPAPWQNASTPLSDEEYMSEANKKHFRKILLDWKQQLLQEMERTVHHLQGEVTSFADPNDRATQEEEFYLELRTSERETKLIRKIEEALQRIDNNEYGFCEACGVQISLQRLEARPTATLCIDCKTIDEIREKSYI